MLGGFRRGQHFSFREKKNGPVVEKGGVVSPPLNVFE